MVLLFATVLISNVSVTVICLLLCLVYGVMSFCCHRFVMFDVRRFVVFAVLCVLLLRALFWVTLSFAAVCEFVCFGFVVCDLFVCGVAVVMLCVLLLLCSCLL